MDTREFSDARLGIDFTTDRPISAEMLADSFKGLSSLYRKEVALRTDGDFLEGSEFVLYITKIESKCIYTELAGYVGSALPIIHVIDYGVTLDAFQTRIRALMRYFGSRNSNAGTVLPEVRPISLTEAKDFLKVIKAAGDGGVKIDRRLYSTPTELSIIESFEFTPPQVKAAIEGVTDYINENTQAEDADFKMVSLYFDRLNRANASGSARSPEKGTIEIISSKSPPVRWISDMDDMRVKSIEANLFDLIFNVDVKVDYVRGKPTAYRVLKLHDWQSPDFDPELP